MSNYKFKINGKSYEVSVNAVNGGVADVTVNGIGYSVEIEGAPEQAVGNGSAAAPVAGTGTPVSAPAGNSAPAAANGTPAAGGKKIVSPLPGVIIDVCVSEGESVKRGQKIAVLEAMKMENEILAEADGTVTKLHVKKGDSILEGADIATVA